VNGYVLRHSLGVFSFFRAAHDGEAEFASVDQGNACRKGIDSFSLEWILAGGGRLSMAI
jgi:hypothetical protein